MDYHKLTPNWFHKRIKQFMQKNCRDVDFSHIEAQFSDEWEVYEPPFSVKLRNNYGYYNEIAKADTIRQAFRIGSIAVQGNYKEDDLLVVDNNGKEVQ